MKNQRGFTLVEALILVFVVVILATLGTVTVSHVVSAAKEQKLFSDVETLNRSISAYVASGGDLSKAKSPEEVLKALKRILKSASQVPTLSGSKVDERLSLNMQDAADTNDNSWRAYWDSTTGRFTLAQSGSSPGIKEFILDDNLVNQDEVDDEAASPVLYASKDTWIWDYTDVAPPVPAGPSAFQVAEVPDSKTPPPTGLPGGGGAAPTPLDPPQFSISSGTFPITLFDLPLTLTNPNPAGSSSLYYSIDFGNWSPYSGPLTVAPGSVVAAQSIATSDLYQNSANVDQKYDFSPVGLAPPFISPSRPTFGLFSDRTLTVALTDQNNNAISSLQYKIGGDPWQDYTGPFSVRREDSPNGALVQARAMPRDNRYLSSTTTLRTLGLDVAAIGGTGTGSFSNPEGDAKMVTNLANLQSSEYFAWGDDKGNSLSQSSLTYEDQNFGNITTGERFQIGTMSYYNGVILSNTGANKVSFSTDLNFTISGVNASTAFVFDLELINVANNGNPKDPWADADYVKLANPTASQTVSFNGVEFNFQLEFGDSSANGITYFDEFHVLEELGASTKVYGTLVEVGSVSFNK